MILKMHSSVQIVAEFMQRHIPADQLVDVANAIYFLAQPLWSKPLHGAVYPLLLEEESVIEEMTSEAAARIRQLFNEKEESNG